VVGAVWFTIVSSTIYYWIYGIEVLIDKDIDLYYLTLPLLGFNLLYTLASIFIFCVYITISNKVKNYQQKKIIESKRDFDKNNSTRSGAIRSVIVSDSTKSSLCSIIIPSRNEENVIRETIHNCLSQTYQNIEVIVVCHNCSDKTYDKAQVQDKRVKVFNLVSKESGKGVALNFGIENSNGNFILVLDGDGRLSATFIEDALPMFEDKVAAVQGKYIPSNRGYNLFTKLVSIEGDLWSTPYMTIRSFLQKKVFLGGTGFIIRKNILLSIGRFTNHLVDDYELSTRLFKMNYKVLFAPLSIDYDEKPPSLEIMFRQRARWARGFNNMLRRKAVVVSDIIGIIYWLNPIAAITGILVLLIYGYATIFNLIFEYYPYSYSYIPLKIWFLLIGIVFVMQCTVLVKEYGRKGLEYSAYLILYNPFSLYYFVTFFKALFVKSWENTKTIHGFTKEAEIQHEHKKW
jgi:cellulose synthase/poly-beta-1,6-N-acetylglucosamine synthase-like glycosyltransferase